MSWIIELLATCGVAVVLFWVLWVVSDDVLFPQVAVIRQSQWMGTWLVAHILSFGALILPWLVIPGVVAYLYFRVRN